MEDNESITTRNEPVNDTSSRRSPYEVLLRQSKKMGGAATKTMDLTKEFLKRDVSTIRPKAPEALLFGRKAEPANKFSVGADEARQINEVVQRSHEVLAGARTVPVPMNLFPDSVIVDRTKVTIINRTFFWTTRVITTRIEDILSVTSNFGPLFGSLTISTRVMNSTDHYEINFFWRKDAEYLKELIQGYVIAQHNDIKTSHLSRDDLIDTLLELGRDSTM